MTRAEREAYKLVPLALARQFQSILVQVDTSHDTDGAQRADGDNEGGFSITDDSIDDYAGQSAG